MNPAAKPSRATLRRIGQVLDLLYALGGPVLEASDELADKAFSQTTQPIEMRKLAENGLGELMRLAGREERLKLT